MFVCAPRHVIDLYLPNKSAFSSGVKYMRPYSIRLAVYVGLVLVALQLDESSVGLFTIQSGHNIATG